VFSAGLPDGSVKELLAEVLSADPRDTKIELLEKCFLSGPWQDVTIRSSQLIK
jgi:hypothetical protein